jgi:hypothetical protein
MFLNITPFSLLKVNRRSVYNLLRAGFLPDFSTAKDEAICASETAIDFQRTTDHYIPEDRTLH